MPRRWSHAALTLDLPSDRPLSLVIVADTHSKPHPRSSELIAARHPDHILHAGDIGDAAVLDAFGELAPTTAVRGNIDGLGQPDSVAVDMVGDGGKHFALLLTHIAVYGPKLRADAARRAKQHQASMVICGHSHVPFIGRDRGLTVFNPGSIGPRRFGLPITFGVMEISHDCLDLHHVNCETGERWEP
jgi:putative phosphoesterase